MGAIFGKTSSKPRPSTSNSGSSGSNNNRRTAANTSDVSDKDRAILELKNARDRLKKYRKRLELESSKLTEQAKEHIRAQQRDRAMLLLKLRKHKEKAVEDINSQLITLMQQIQDVEWASISTQVFGALRVGTDLLNKMHDEISVDDVASLLDEAQDAIDVENQINSLLAGQLTSLEESDLLAELDQLSATAAGGAGLSTSVNDVHAIVQSMPEAPEGHITVLPPVPTHGVEPNANASEERSAPIMELA